MKSLSLLAFSLSLTGLALIGCERHSFDETKGLHLEHGKHHEEHHGEGDHPKDDHGKDPHAKDKERAKAPEAAPAAPKEEPRKTGI